MSAVICDIETGPADAGHLDLVKPEFTAAKNLRDPEKIKADLAEKEGSWRERAALDAKTAKILAIGIWHPQLNEPFDYVLGTGMETEILKRFWLLWNSTDTVIGFAIKHFDAPMLIRRSWLLGIPVPKDVINGRYLSDKWVDLQSIWCLHSRDISGESLDAVSKAFGLPGKTGHGKDFANLLATDTKAALAYLRNDCFLVTELGRRLGVIQAPPPF